MALSAFDEGRSLTLRICDALKVQIAEGVYPQDSSLPSTRRLASELGVSRTTVIAAYDQLIAEGYLETHQGSRARVISGSASSPGRSKIPPLATEPHLSHYGRRLPPVASLTKVIGPLVADFRPGDIASCDFPMLSWKRSINTALLSRLDCLRYGDPAGSLTLRKALQGYLWRARGIRCATEQIIIVNGSQEGLGICSRLLLDPGEKAVIEDPCYGMARKSLLSVGAELQAIPVDHEGMRTDLLVSVKKARLAYLTPSHQFPLGSVMPVTRRQEFLAWAERAGAYIVEDDYDCEYRFDVKPIQPLYSLSVTDNIIYSGTFSKTLSPLLRLGYLVVPNNLVKAFTEAKWLADRGSSHLEQEALADFIASGAYERHICQIRRKNSERRRILLDQLCATLGDKIIVEGTAAGLHIVVWFKNIPTSLEDTLVTQASLAGVGLCPISPLYSAYRPSCAGIVVGFAGLSEKEITRGIQCLAKVIGKQNSSLYANAG